MNPWMRPIIAGVAVAIAAGLLEAAWTGPGRGAPTNTWLGVIAILIIFIVATFPHVWLIPALAVLEESVHGFVGYPGWVPTWNTVFAHWSHSYVGFPLMPYLTFPLLTLGGFLVAWTWWNRVQRRRRGPPVASEPGKGRDQGVIP